MSRSRFAGARLVMPLYIAVSAFLLLEIVLRLTDPLGISYFFETRRYFASLESDPDFAYIHPAGFQGEFQGVRVSINSDGFRGPPIDRVKRKGVRRILLLGDSLVFGWGAPQEAIFPIQLERLAREAGYPWEVIPAGVVSWNTRTEAEYLSKRGLDLDPDVVVLVVLPNDVEPKRKGKTAISKEKLFPPGARGEVLPLPERLYRAAGARSFVVAAIRNLAVQKGSRGRSPAKFDQTTPDWQDVELAIDAMATSCRERGVLLVGLIHGGLDDPFVHAFENSYQSAFDARSIPWVVMKKLEGDSLRNSAVDRHPNAEGHRILALRSWKLLLPLIEGEQGSMN